MRYCVTFIAHLQIKNQATWNISTAPCKHYPLDPKELFVSPWTKSHIQCTEGTEKSGEAVQLPHQQQIWHNRYCKYTKEDVTRGQDLEDEQFEHKAIPDAITPISIHSLTDVAPYQLVAMKGTLHQLSGIKTIIWNDSTPVKNKEALLWTKQATWKLFCAVNTLASWKKTTHTYSPTSGSNKVVGWSTSTHPKITLVYPLKKLNTSLTPCIPWMG